MSEEEKLPTGSFQAEPDALPRSSRRSEEAKLGGEAVRKSGGDGSGSEKASILPPSEEGLESDAGDKPRASTADQPKDEKRVSLPKAKEKERHSKPDGKPLLAPEKGKGAIAHADKKAQELAGKVKDFFAHGEKTGEASSQKPLRRPKKIYENSYRLAPHNTYSRDKAQRILETTLDEMMKGVRYQSDTAGDLAVKICEKIRSRLLATKFDRYKIIVMANVGPLNRQGIHIGFRSLMDAERDTYNMATVKSAHAFCTAVVYAIYFE